MKEILLPIVLFAGILGLIALLVFVAIVDSRRKIGRWAEAQRLTLMRCEMGMWPKSRLLDGQSVVWKVRVAGGDGNPREAWLRTGVIPGEVEVTWAREGESIF